MPNKTAQLKHVISYYAFLLVVWGFFRALIRLPEPIEELVLKPLIWILPLVFVLKKEGGGLESLGWTTKGLLKSIFYIVIAGGLIYEGVVISLGLIFEDNLDKINLFTSFGAHKDVLLSGLALSVVTAVIEETVFRGFIFNRLNKIFNNELFANVVSSVAWVLIHMPIFIFVYKLSPDNLVFRGLLSTVFAVASAYLFARTKNIVPSVFLHIFWPWVLILLK